MVIEPKVRGFFGATAHPRGCAENVRRQIEYVQSRGVVNGADAERFFTDRTAALPAQPQTQPQRESLLE